MKFQSDVKPQKESLAFVFYPMHFPHVLETRYLLPKTTFPCLKKNVIWGCFYRRKCKETEPDRDREAVLMNIEDNWTLYDGRQEGNLHVFGHMVTIAYYWCAHTFWDSSAWLCRLKGRKDRIIEHFEYHELDGMLDNISKVLKHKKNIEKWFS